MGSTSHVQHAALKTASPSVFEVGKLQTTAVKELWLAPTWRAVFSRDQQNAAPSPARAAPSLLQMQEYPDAHEETLEPMIEPHVEDHLMYAHV